MLPLINQKIIIIYKKQKIVNFRICKIYLINIKFQKIRKVYRVHYNRILRKEVGILVQQQVMGQILVFQQQLP